MSCIYWCDRTVDCHQKSWDEKHIAKCANCCTFILASALAFASVCSRHHGCAGYAKWSSNIVEVQSQQILGSSRFSIQQGQHSAIHSADIPLVYQHLSFKWENLPPGHSVGWRICLGEKIHCAVLCVLLNLNNWNNWVLPVWDSLTLSTAIPIHKYVLDHGAFHFNSNQQYCIGQGNPNISRETAANPIVVHSFLPTSTAPMHPC